MISTLEKDKWKTLPLGEVADFLDNLRKPVKESDRVVGPYPYFGANGIQGWIDQYLFDEPLILLAEDGGNFGSKIKPIAYTIEGKTWVNNHAHVLRPKSFIDIRFLLHTLRFYNVTAYIKGATRAKLTKGDAEKLPILFPSLKEQKRIAAILDKADSLRRKRQQAIQLTDDFLRATFIDMFGDPVSNSRGWPEKKISEISVITTGNTPSRAIESNFGCAIEWIKSDNINTPNHFLTLASEYLSETGMTVGRSVPAGSTLMTCIAGSPSCIGNVAMTDRKVAFNQQINAMTPLADLMPEFLYCLLLFSKKRIQASSTNSMKGMISKGVLAEIKLIWPSVNLQRKFVLIFKKTMRLREQMNEAEMAPLQNTLNSKSLS